MSPSLKLLDYWQPPEGVGDPIACLATTFMFEPDFFEIDCLGRFLGLDARPGEDDRLLAMIEEDERLSETPVSVIVDRTYNPVQRNLRWDLLPVGIRGGVMHAKVSILLWRDLARFVIGSANLTRAGYRHQVETAAVLEASPDTSVPDFVFRELLDGVRTIVNRADDDPVENGPKRRALETLQRAEQHVRRLRLPSGFGRGEPRITVALGEPDRPVLPQFERVWAQGPPSEANVLSPYFDAGERVRDSVDALSAQMNQRHSSISFTLPSDQESNRRIVRAPIELAEAGSKRLELSFQTFRPEKPDDERRLHGKAVILGSDTWVAGMIGSSNFTSPGLAVGRTANLELNLLVGAPWKTKVGKSLWGLWPDGEPITPGDVAWEPSPDEEEQAGPSVPWGFRGCFLEPGDPSVLILRFHRSDLPAHWRIEIPGGPTLIDEATWHEHDDPSEWRHLMKTGDPAYWVEVHWETSAGWVVAGLPVNVTDPGRLLPPDELRSLPPAVLLDALASTRPIHEALVAAIQRQTRANDPGLLDPQLDPLKRHAGAGRLLRRAREVSAALFGLRQRLERPLTSPDALIWRLHGPVGPVAIARSLAKGAADGEWIDGEVKFALAELVLTLGRVRWNTPSTQLTNADVSSQVHDVVKELRKITRALPPDPILDAYVRRAFAQVAA